MIIGNLSIRLIDKPLGTDENRTIMEEMPDGISPVQRREAGSQGIQLPEISVDGRQSAGNERVKC